MCMQMEHTKLACLEKYKDYTKEDWDRMILEGLNDKEYWKKDAELQKELTEENEKRHKSIEMSHEKFTRKFDL